MSQQPYPAVPGMPGGRDRRPGTVTAACVTTLVFAGLTLVLFGITLLGMLAAREEFTDLVEQDPSFARAGIDVDEAYGVVVGIVGFLALWCVVACVLAVMALRRSNGARIALALSAVLSAVLSLFAALGAVVPVIVTVASVAVAVLLFSGGANDWYAGRPAGHAGPPHGWNQEGQQFSQYYGASAGPQAPYGHPGDQAGGHHPGYPGYPGSQPGPGPGPEAGGEPGPRPGEHGGPDDDRPVQRPWG